MSTKTPSPINRNTALCYIRKSWTFHFDDNDEAITSATAENGQQRRKGKYATDNSTEQISPERQRSHIQAICDANGWNTEWYEDTEKHKSGMHEKNRPGWLALKSRMSDPDVVAIVANDLARLHRKGWRISHLLDFVDEHGIKLVIADPRRQIDFSTPYGRMFAQLSAIFDEWYALDISERRKADIAHRKSEGKTVGRPPFGTKRDGKGYLIPSDEGVWLLPDKTWVPGKAGDVPPTENALWRGYYECAERILTLYAERWAGRTKIAELLMHEGWAWRSDKGHPAPFETEDVRRVTNNWVEYGGAVIGKRARERSPLDYDSEKILLNPEKAVFDIELLKKVGRVQKERTVKPPDRGHSRTDHPYPLSGITYCAACEQLALQQNNPKLRSRLGGKSQSRYRHKAGFACGCTKKSVSRDALEEQFIGIIRQLTVKPEMIDQMRQLAYQAQGIRHNDEQSFEKQKASAIAKCQRRIEAAHHLYEDGDLSRQEYLRRKEQNETEIIHWQTFTTEAESINVEIAMCVDALTKITQLWESSDDEDKQGLARYFFEYIVFDLDQQRIVQFKLKAWANRYLILRHEVNAKSAGNVDIEGTNRVPSPVRATKLSVA